MRSAERVGKALCVVDRGMKSRPVRNRDSSKMNIALKEASETEYWLELLFESEYITSQEFNSIYPDCEEIIKILVSITKTQNK